MPYFISMKSGDNIISAVILAGGRSSRMGYPKPWIRVGDNPTFLASIVNTFKESGVEDVVVVLNENFVSKKWKIYLDEIEKNAAIILNDNPERGRLYSLQLGLKAIKSNSLFIHNVDSPFVDKEVIKKLSAYIEKKDVVIPVFEGKGGHPVLVNNVVKKEIINKYNKYITLKDVFLNFSKKYIEVDNNSILKNINTPQELEVLCHEFV